MFHAPNYFLPPEAERGVITIHDLSVFKFPESHPLERIQQYERSFLRSLGQSVQLITGSEATRAEIMAYFGWPEDRISAIAHGVGPEYKPRPAGEVAHALQP